MKLKQILPAAVVAAFAATGTGAIAAGDENMQSQQGASGASAPQPVKQPFSKLDNDGDGVLGYAEAAADKDAASRFHEIDKNNDQDVSRSEYEAWNPDQGAATGATSGKQSK